MLIDRESVKEAAIQELMYNAEYWHRKRLEEVKKDYSYNATKERFILQVMHYIEKELFKFSIQIRVDFDTDKLIFKYIDKELE